MFRLKANKTSLYKLVGEFEDLPPMRRVTITKAYRAPDWWLKWTDAEGMLCMAFFSTCLGKPLLAIDKKEFGGPCQRQSEIVRKRRRNFVVFRRKGG